MKAIDAHLAEQEWITLPDTLHVRTNLHIIRHAIPVGVSDELMASNPIGVVSTEISTPWLLFGFVWVDTIEFDGAGPEWLVRVVPCRPEKLVSSGWYWVTDDGTPRALAPAERFPQLLDPPPIEVMMVPHDLDAVFRSVRW